MALRLRNAMKRFLPKNSICAERRIPALGDQCCLTSQRFFTEKCSQDIRNASLRVFWVFAKKVLTIGDSKLLTRNKLSWGSLCAARSSRRVETGLERALPACSHCVMLSAKA